MAVKADSSCTLNALPLLLLDRINSLSLASCDEFACDPNKQTMRRTKQQAEMLLIFFFLSEDCKLIEHNSCKDNQDLAAVYIGPAGRPGYNTGNV